MCELTFPVLQKHVSAVITVSEEEIISAMKLVGYKLLLEVLNTCMASRIRIVTAINVRFLYNIH